jgi:ribosomal protein S18 acetylase RimI-like enzyme
VLTEAAGLTGDDLAAIEELEHRVVTHDGGRLKLEWGVLRSRSGRRVDDLLWWEGGNLLGFLGIYQFGGSKPEFAGMVDPAARRAGIGTALLAGARDVASNRDCRSALIVVPRSTAAGAEFALSQGAVLEHSEHHMELVGTPDGRPIRRDVSVRTASPADVDAIDRILSEAFGEPRGSTPVSLDDASDQQLVVERGGVIVGALRLATDDSVTGIYGLAVDPRLQGQGIGRDVLGRVVHDLRSGDRQHQVTLEVSTTNERALGLYTSVGFERRTTEDYYELALS